MGSRPLVSVNKVLQEMAGVLIYSLSVLLCFALRTLQTLCCFVLFNKRQVCDNSGLSRSISAIF